MRAMFYGRRYEVKYVKKLKNGNHGECDHYNAGNKSIRILESLEPKRKLVVTLHESLHACMWPLSEAAVGEMSEDIGNLLWKLGYRKVDEVKKK
jgi:hypothetical protein